MKTVLGEGWIKVRNMMNKYFAAGAPCSICGRFSCSPVWYNYQTKEIRCTKCFDPFEDPKASYLKKGGADG